MKTPTRLLALLLIPLLIFSLSPPLQADTTGRAEDTSLAGTERILSSSSGTNTYIQVSTLLTSPTITAPVLSGSVTGTYTLAGTPTITAPVLSGSVTGTYGLGGTVTITAPILSGSVTGTYTLAGTPTITSPTITSPTITGATLTTPALGVATATSVNKVAITAPATSATLTIANGKTLAASNTLTLAGTDGTTMTFPSTSATIARTDAANTFTGVQTMTSAALTTPVLTGSVTGTYTLAGTPTITAPVLSGTVTGTYTLGGTPTITGATLTSPALGVATATSVNKVAITAPATSATLTIANGKTLTASNTLTLAGTDGTTMTFPSTSATIARTDAANTFTGVQTMTSAALTTPVLTGSVTGTYTLAGTPTITAPTITAFTATGTSTIGAGLTVTSPAIVTPTIKDLTEVVTATNVITAAETGSVFFLNSSSEFVSTLPAPAAGLRYTFIVTAAPSGASYTVVTASSANVIKGLQNSVAGDAGDSGTADDTVTFVDGQSVAGDKVEVWCDGTNWFAYAVSKVAAGITFTQAN